MVLFVTTAPISRLGRMFMARLTGGLWHFWFLGRAAPQSARRIGTA